MCGIAGYSGLSKSEQLLGRMTGSILHRGPDEGGSFFHDRVGLGMRRLSIIDTKSGSQPIYNRDKTVVVVFNGEIYNYHRLAKKLKAKGYIFSTNSDTETIVHLYDEMGMSLLHELRGMFCFSLYDLKTKTLYIARDRLGIKPLYYYNQSGKFLFASEIKAILEADFVSKIPNISSIDSFLKFRYSPGPETMFKDIYKLPAGHWMSVREGKIEIEQYWDPKSKMLTASRKIKLTDREYEEKFAEIFEETMRLHLVSDVPVGSYLSGGLDSSLVTASAKQYTDYKINTFCVGFGWGNDETSVAREVSENLNTNHHEILCNSESLNFLPKMIWHNDEPIGDPIALPTYLLSKLASQHVKVVLTGEGADEFLGGYLFHRVMLDSNSLLKFIPKMAVNNFFSPLIRHTPTHLLDSVFDYPAYLGERGRKKVSRFLSLAANKNPKEIYEFLITLFDQDDRRVLYANQSILGSSGKDKNSEDFHSSDLSFLNNAILAQTQHWLPDNVLLRQDKMSMANSLEARVPFLDHVLVEFLMEVPLHLKIKLFGKQNKLIARKYSNKLLTKKAAERKKKAFYIPTEHFLHSKDFQFLVKETLNKDQIKKRGYFNPEIVSNLIQEADRNKEFISAKQIFSLVSLEIWHQIFIEGKSWT
ncbi:MAG: asparagine synthase (glutamine-hydrolyzing) [Oligoflexia bacterium]|nr:asparagine synthase (glutamine-hydrolyzing) [Oligoflexia bacterium]